MYKKGQLVRVKVTTYQDEFKVIAIVVEEVPTPISYEGEEIFYSTIYPAYRLIEPGGRQHIASWVNMEAISNES